MKNRRKYFYWGPFPDEKDGGAVVNYYLIKKQYKIRQDEYYAKCKVPEELNRDAMPYVAFLGYPEIDKYEDIADSMQKRQIPLLNIFHIGPEDFERVIDPVHEVGGKIVLHQTIHWPDDTCLNSGRLNDFDGIVCPTKYAKRIFMETAGVKADILKYIPHAVDVSKYKKERFNPIRDELGIDRYQKVILYTGRLSFWKGVQELIPIMRKLYNEYDCVFIIRGGAFWGNREGRALHKIFSRMSRNNPNVIYMPEWKPHSYMEKLHCISDINVFVSAHEGFGVPLIEAMACEAVPIASALPNQLEICGKTGERAILLTPKKQVGVVNEGTPLKVPTSDAIEGAIRWILENPDEAEVMGRNGRRRVVNSYNLKTIAKTWLEYYDSLVPEDYNMDREAIRNI